MISLKRYLYGQPPASTGPVVETTEILTATLEAYGAAMLAMGDCSVEACPALGDGLKRRLAKLELELSPMMSREAIDATKRAVQEHLQEWGQNTARHYREKAAEVKDLLLMMARAGEAVGARDQRCASQMGEVTTRLKQIATLDDLTQIRTSVERSAVDLKSSIERMTAEGKAAMAELKKQVSVYQEKLEEAEELASRDALTGVHNRMCAEAMIESRIAAGIPFCLTMLDIDGFKAVNDTHGHVIGDELLKEFAGQLRAQCRSTDVIGRWGGDEFVILVNCCLADATAQMERLRKWVSGNYTVRAGSGAMKLRLDFSFGLAEHLPQEPLKSLMERADAAMYQRKTGARGSSAA